MIKYRNIWGQVGLFVITLGIYGFFWFYWVSKEMLDYNGRTGRPGLWTVGLIIPFVNFISWWKFSEQVEEISGGKYNALLIFIAWWVFAPITWYVAQSQLNELAGQPASDTAQSTA